MPQSQIPCTVQIHSLCTAKHAHRAAIERLRGGKALLEEEMCWEHYHSMAHNAAP